MLEKSRVRRHVFGLLLTALLGASGALPAYAAEMHRFDVSTADAATAIHDFGVQAGVQILAAGANLRGKQLNEVSGELSTDEGLRILLAGTGLTHQYVGERAVALVAESTTPSAAEEPKETSPASPPEVLEEIVVTGSHIRGVDNGTLPIKVLDRAYIESTGFGTTSRLIESLPENFALTSQSGIIVDGVTGAELQGSSINLRGIGEGTTLVLLDGRRMASGYFSSAVDISALPLSAIERVEVLTDGNSAIYGADAIGGVVNFILRSDFEGSETRLRGGVADGGVEEYRVSQALGRSWSSGNALLSAEYYRRDLLSATERDFVPAPPFIGSLLPRDENYSLLLSGRQAIAESASIFADALYTHREGHNIGQVSLDRTSDIENPQLLATLGATAGLGNRWQAELAATYARDKMDALTRATNLPFGAGLTQTRFEIRAGQLKADGPLLDLPAGAVRGALGAEWRAEKFHYKNAFGAFVVADREVEQTVRSAFAEAYVPIVGAGNARAGARRIELSLAGRFDDYSSFGHSFNPKFGLLWEPLTGLSLRASYGTSYKPPKLDDYQEQNFAGAFEAFDPAFPSGLSRQFWIGGVDVTSFVAQEADTLSLGFELAPAPAPGLKLALNYYSIDYRHQIATPPGASVMLLNPSAYASLFVRDPSQAQVEELIALAIATGGGYFNPGNFDPDSFDVIVDLRKRNLSVTESSGLDASVQYALPSRAGDLHLGLDAAYILERNQRVTATSTAAETVDTFGFPPRLRLRGSAGLTRAAWSTNVFLNYTDSYTDNRTTTPVPIASFTTVDAQLAYDFGRSIETGLRSGLTGSISVQNLLDRDPPHTAAFVIDRDLGFDPTNANPLGRFIALELVKKL